MATRSKRVDTSPSLVDVVRTGDRRRSLEALRDHLAEALEHPQPGVAIGPIAAQLRAVLEELDSLPTGREESKVADLSARIARRKAASGL